MDMAGPCFRKILRRLSRSCPVFVSIFSSLPRRRKSFPAGLAPIRHRSPGRLDIHLVDTLLALSIVVGNQSTLRVERETSGLDVFVECRELAVSVYAGQSPRAPFGEDHGSIRQSQGTLSSIELVRNEFDSGSSGNHAGNERYRL